MGVYTVAPVHLGEKSRVRGRYHAKIEDTFGFGVQIGYNLNDHWNLAGLFSWSQPDYQALVQPAAGNALPARSSNGTIQTNTFGFAVT